MQVFWGVLHEAINATFLGCIAWGRQCKLSMHDHTLHRTGLLIEVQVQVSKVASDLCLWALSTTQFDEAYDCVSIP